MSLLAKILLFISSYFPLFLIILLKNYKKIWDIFIQIINVLGDFQIFNISSILKLIYYIINPLIILLLAVIIGLAFLAYLLIKNETYVSNIIQIDNISNITSESLTYIISYMIPFLSIQFESTLELYCALILFITIGIIYVNSDMLYINPTLTCFRYKTYKFDGTLLNTDKKIYDAIIITKKNISQIKKNKTIKCLEYSNNFFIANDSSIKEV